MVTNGDRMRLSFGSDQSVQFIQYSALKLRCFLRSYEIKMRLEDRREGRGGRRRMERGGGEVKGDCLMVESWSIKRVMEGERRQEKTKKGNSHSSNSILFVFSVSFRR